MIQRVQSVFLLLAVVTQVLFLAFPLAGFVMETNESINLYASGFKSATGETLLATIPLHILSWAICGLIFVTIFLYRKRILQIRICIYNMLLNIGLIGLMVLQLTNFSKNNAVLSHQYGIPMAIPVVSIILLYLAFRGIRKDEVLVKAQERLR